MHIISLFGRPAAKQRPIYFAGQFSSLPFPISAPQPGTGKTTLLSHDAWHSGRAWQQIWSQIGVVCSIHTEWNHWHRLGFITPRKNLKASSTWTEGEFWQTCWAHFGLCSVGVNWTRQLGQSAMEGWPYQHSVNNTGCVWTKVWIIMLKIVPANAVFVCDLAF